MDSSAEVSPKQMTRSERIKIMVIDNIIIICLVIAVIIGVGLGIGLRDVWKVPDDNDKLFFLEFPGQILLSMLKCLILPLVVSSIISAVSSLPGKASGKLGAGAIIYYMTTTVIAVIIGIVLVESIQPGHQGEQSITKTGKSKDVKPLYALLDVIRNCFPENIIAACFEKMETDPRSVNVTTGNDTVAVLVDNPKIRNQPGTNILGLIVFSVALGCVIKHLGVVGRPLQFLFESLNAATMVLINLVIWYSPIGIMFLIAKKFAEMEDPARVVGQLGFYCITVLAGLLIHGTIALPLIYFITTRKNPYIFIFRMMKAILTAWGTASSSASLPITMECLINNNKVHRDIARFVAPIGATINMDGTALYEAVAAIFIAQYNGKDLGVDKVIIVSITATVAAIGAAGVPQAGLVTMIIVLTAVGLPTDDVTLILAVDWFVDRFRTAINVMGDAIGAGILNHVFRDMFADVPDVESEMRVDADMMAHKDDVKLTPVTDTSSIPSLNGDFVMGKGAPGDANMLKLSDCVDSELK
ncbi:excitatory amino acid transporter 1-like [Gigantopelta aegis]|uniref:excitatory amino acid transporter 1-like n=1 Tax=Gigantopelta aegis TaxID=1735272 RepID=UPI001B88D77E|nr:excitatory amino acid transporter 1-like [Gigantopelta aegis]XP_041358518.1 excitatory amino acid transporter 1-like [Gigantopelta aegis]